MVAKMRFINWVETAVLMGMSVSGSSVHYPTNATTVTSSISKALPSKTTSQPASITSCTAARTSYIDIWESFMNKTLLGWSSTSPERYSSAIESIEGEIYTLFSRYSMIQANPWTIPTATWNSYESSIVKAISTYSSIEWGAAQDAVGVFGWSPWTDEPCLWTTCTNQLYSMSSAYASANPNGAFEYTAQPPCCSECVVNAKGVKLAYWPTPAPTPGISTLVDTSGNTFISPSVYAWILKLNAWDGCGFLGPSTYIDTFLSFHPTDLRTSSASFDPWANYNRWTTINFADFGPQCTCTPPACPSDSLVGYQSITCTPHLSIPNALTKLFPEWASCGVNFDGVFDPPYALTVQPGLTTPKSTSATPTSDTSPSVTNASGNPSGTGPSAQPANTPSPSGPTITPQPPNNIPQSPTPNNSPQQSPNPRPSSASVNDSPSLPAGGVTTTIPPSLVLNGQTITADTRGFFVVGTSTLSVDAQGNIIVGGQTVTAGASAVTIDGKTASLGVGVTEVVFGGTSTTQLGSIIASFVDGGGSDKSTISGTSSVASGTVTTTGVVQFTGAASLSFKGSMALVAAVFSLTAMMTML